MPDASPYIEAAYAVFVVLLATYVGIITYRMRNTARERRRLEAELAARTTTQPDRELERV
jgi:hypothetical protein